MLRFDKSPAQGERRGVNFFYFEVFQAEYDAGYVEDGIDRTDFMKMDIMRWDPMDPPFGIGKTFENGQALFTDPGIEAAFVEKGLNVRKPAMRLPAGGN